MIKVVLVDDEAYIRNSIKTSLIDDFREDIESINEAESVASAVKLIQELKPDLLFLDIHLQDGTGFDILSKIDTKNLNIIFITGYDNHAIKAVKVGALDYLLKPIDQTELKKAMVKAIQNYKQEKDFKKLVEISAEYFNGVQKKRIVLKTLESVHFVYEDDILYCQSDGNYTTIHLKELKQILVSKPIKKVLELLSENVFIRCHQSYVVNKKHVIRYDKQGLLVMNSNDMVPVSRRLKDLVIEQIF